MKQDKQKLAKPFVKWAGGKTQLLKQIELNIPQEIKENNFTFIEPFVGGGAVLFYILNNYPNAERIVINDINIDLINTYRTIKNEVEKLIIILQKWEREFHQLLKEEEKKRKYYYKKREVFNQRKSDKIKQSALFIFLNKTCFNGLYRVNRKNEFNVPIGSYKNPLICDKENLIRVNALLQKVEILNGDFEHTLTYAKNKTLFYFDPPYKPLNDTSSFNSYTKDDFNDEEQIRLAKFCKKVDELNYDWILSNSDLKSSKSNNNFFDLIFKDFNINRVLAKRNINANPDKRGLLTELLITNN